MFTPVAAAVILAVQVERGDSRGICCIHDDQTSAIRVGIFLASVHAHANMQNDLQYYRY
jgi:hypothetical protein